KIRFGNGSIESSKANNTFVVSSIHGIIAEREVLVNAFRLVFDLSNFGPCGQAKYDSVLVLLQALKTLAVLGDLL
ncbi:MAG: hypothetical protein Q9226_002160, partial [Calogaya cf. arnoldii]